MRKSKSMTIERGDEKFSEMMVSAVRYALGRKTYVVSDTCGYIKHVLPLLTENDIGTIYRDIADAEREKRLGDECDVCDWLMLKKNIEDFMRKKSRRQFYGNNR